MHLRIQQKPETRQVLVQLEKDGQIIAYHVDAFDSPHSKALRQAFASFYAGVPSEPKPDKTVLNIAEKLISGGQRLADNLLGEDHELMKIIHEIEEAGFAKLEVSIDSDDSEFFEEFWETVVLPDTKYVLSASVSRFSRINSQLYGQLYGEPDSEIELGLVAHDRMSGQLSSILGEQPQDPIDSQPSPLRALWVVAQSGGAVDAHHLSQAVGCANRAVREGGNLVYELMLNPSPEAVNNRLQVTDKPIHILHYFGDVCIGEGNIYYLANDQRHDLLGVFQACGAASLGCVSMDVREYVDEQGLAIPHQRGFHAITQIACRAYKGNILGLSQAVLPQSSSVVFHSVYRALTLGVELGQAVVEARKELQRNSQDESFNPSPVPFPMWPLLLHFGQQKVRFFQQGVSQIADIPSGWGALQERIFGFDLERLSVGAGSTSDSIALPVADYCQTRGGKVAIVGSEGMGKTYTAQRVAVYLAAAEKVDNAFYFSCQGFAYELTDVIHMTAGVLEAGAEDVDNFAEALAQKRCCFVFDDFDSRPVSQEVVAILERFNQIVIATGRDVFSDAYKTFRLSGIINIDRRLIACDSLRTAQLSQQDTFAAAMQVAERCGGNPWLQKKLIPELSLYSVDEILARLTDYPVDSVKDGFYRQYWATLPHNEQVFFSLLAQSPAVLMEMLGAVIQQNDSYWQSFSGEESTHENYRVWVDKHYQHGFLRRSNLGHMLGRDEIDFIVAQQAQIDDEHAVLFSRWVCESLSFLSGRVSQQNNSEILNYLVVHRADWVLHFERLWQNDKFAEFFGVKNAVERLFMSVGLVPELASWCLELLNRHPLPDRDYSQDQVVAWLALAAELNKVPSEIDVEWIAPTVVRCRTSYSELDATASTSALPYFHQLATFLLAYYERNTNWAECISVAERALGVYRHYDSWPRVVSSLKALVRYNRASGDKDQARLLEDQLLNDVPYEEAEPGFKLQQQIEILLTQVADSDFDRAQRLLQQIRAHHEVPPHVQDLLKNVECDIDYGMQNYEAALPVMSKLWSRAKAASQDTQLKELQQKLTVIKSALGDRRFNEILAKEDADGDKQLAENLTH
ncbi:ATP-binding protein [Teredinibacter turnerae]|uniref:ATP-binding protein n=1 Tax=Teredinibacter turnerae TaxID=2426 RepID=UPI00042A9335|nr:ATP-binding protein [Teredinibacter turnerae]